MFREYRTIRTGVAKFIKAGFVKKEDVPRVVKWLEGEGLCENGLYAKMMMHNPHLWYTTPSEYYWLSSFMMTKNYEKAKETLDAILNYTVSTEYYTVERYKDDDPYFGPWSPNASGNARIIDMLCEYYSVLED